MFVAIAVPFFGGLLGFFGGFAFAPTTYFVIISTINFFIIRTFIKNVYNLKSLVRINLRFF